MEESARADLLLLASTFSDAACVSLQAIGQRALNDNTFFARVSAGSNFTLRTYDRLVRWFAENWPEGTEWPRHIEQPEVAE
jgi:hypothetical protein